MILASLPVNCWYVMRHVGRSFGHGIRHPFRHPRHVLRHIHRVRHASPPHRFVEFVCKAANVAGAGAALLAPPAAVVGAAPYVAPYLPAPYGTEQPAPYGGGGYAGGGVGGVPGYGGSFIPAASGGTAEAIPPGLLPVPEDVVLQPAFPPAPPAYSGQSIPPYVPPAPPVITTQNTPHPVPEPSSALVLAIGVLGAIAISVSKKAER